MYVHPFVAGVVCTVMTELLILVVASVIHLYKEKRGKK